MDHPSFLSGRNERRPRAIYGRAIFQYSLDGRRELGRAIRICNRIIIHSPDIAAAYSRDEALQRFFSRNRTTRPSPLVGGLLLFSLPFLPSAPSGFFLFHQGVPAVHAFTFLAGCFCSLIVGGVGASGKRRRWSDAFTPAVHPSLVYFCFPIEIDRSIARDEYRRNVRNARTSGVELLINCRCLIHNLRDQRNSQWLN